MPYWHPGNGWLGGLFMALAMVVLWGGLITVIIVLLRRTTPSSREDNSALRILDERFARGEIHKEEYEERRAALKR